MVIGNLLAEEGKDIGEMMQEALFPENVDFLGMSINPSLRTAFLLTAFVIVVGLILRLFVIPRFKTVPGRFQALLEKACEFVENIAKENSPHSYGFVGCVCFGAIIYISLGTLCELLGIRAILVDLNACLALAVTAYTIMLAGGIKFNKLRGAGSVLKDVSLLLSMSFRLFGSMIGGLMMTELVYSVLFLSFGIPVLVGVVFTIFHAVIQSYVYILLLTMFYGEAAEPRMLDGSKVNKKKKNKKNVDQTIERSYV